MKFLTSIDLSLNELLNAKLQNLGVDPDPTGSQGYIWFNTTSGVVKFSDGTAVQSLSNLLESVSGTGAIQVAGVAGKSQVISILAASDTQDGTQSAANFTKLAASTGASTPSTLVQRDSSGNFAAGTITANLTGTASDASALEGASLASVRDFSLSTGSRPTADALSDFFDVLYNDVGLDQIGGTAGNVLMNGFMISDLGTPQGSTDVATKGYVDSVAVGLDIKASVRLATTADLGLTFTAGHFVVPGGTLSVDGVAAVPGDRILVKNQTLATHNGIFTLNGGGLGGGDGSLERADDFVTDKVSSGAFTFVEEGSQSGTGWVLTNPNPVDVGSSSLAFTQFSGGGGGGGGTYTAGNGLQLSGTQFSAVGTTGRISVSGGGIDIASTYVGQASITTLGTIGTGVWQGSPVGIAYGGTGATTAAVARLSLGAVGKVFQDIGDGTATTITVTHNFGTLDVLTTVYLKSTGEIVYCNVVNATTNTVTLSFATAPATNSYRAVVVG